MSKELIVSAGRHETRVAILEDDQVVELFHEREKEYSLAGSIHKGRVTRVLPGMQSAFVDIGLDRDAFLYVSDFFEDNDEYDAVVSTVEEKVLKMERGGSAPAERPERTDRIERPDRPARQFSSPAPSVETPGVEGAVAEAAAVSAAPVTEQVQARGNRPERGPGGERGADRGGDRGGDRAGGDRGGDRGGRGRRGRRRRGGRDNGGLPESKFFSPRAEAATATPAAAPETGTQPEESTPAFSYRSAPSGHSASHSSSHSSYSSVDDFMVLPGESLAKYSPGDSEPEAVYSAPVAVEEEAPFAEASVAEAPVEAALPVEHPLAGFGSVTSWVTEQVPEKQPEAVTAPEPVVLAPVAAAPELVTPEAEAAEDLLEDRLQIRTSILEPADNTPLDPETEAVETEAAEAEIPGIEAAGEEASLVEVEEASTEEASGDDEPPVEAASATVRDPGQRYPHRVSRRMRRKQRGGQQQNDEASKPAGEERTVAVRDESRGAETAAPQQNQERERGPRERTERERPPLPSISDLLKEGQEIVVQIAKEPLGQKGARITSHIALPGRFVVYMPTVEHVGVSRKIPSDEERQRLKRVLQTHRQGVPGGFICRTAAEGKTEEELKADMHFLYNLWLDMRQKAERKPAPVLLHHDLDLVQRILRDQLTTSFKTIWVDNEELYESVLRFVQRFQPALVGRVKLYTRVNPIFDEFGITAEVEKALRPKVWLKSGGYIVINQTEALVAIDINTGKYVGKSNRLEDTIVKINSDAIKEIVRQIRLRDLGGIIVVDFIDMDERKNRQKVMLALEEGMRADRAPYKILQFNDFGLVAITRKRVKQSLERTLCAPCSYCEGAGYIKSPATVVSEILQEAQRMQKALAAETGNVVLRVNPEVAKLLKSNHNSYLQEIEEIAGRTVLVKSDPLLHQTKFDLA
ncbi:MAG TPA: Rne/Rng family ribonuclease [Bryobacteraceae bacterium]|jgi:ribonuclease G|nr:Rne/Rng family ribonuclease [Bryobacteraceae bacterium]